MAASKSAAIRCCHKRSPFKLRVTIDSQGRGIYWDKLDTTHDGHQFITQTSTKSARRLAQWILDNTEE